MRTACRGESTCGIMFKTRNSTPLAYEQPVKRSDPAGAQRLRVRVGKIEHGGAITITPVTRPVPSGTAFMLFARGSRRTCTRSEWMI